jgi:hypothetical protein
VGQYEADQLPVTLTVPSASQTVLPGRTVTLTVFEDEFVVTPSDANVIPTVDDNLAITAAALKVPETLAVTVDLMVFWTASVIETVMLTPVPFV